MNTLRLHTSIQLTDDNPNSPNNSKRRLGAAIDWSRED